MRLSSTNKILVVIWFATWIGTCALGLTGCEGADMPLLTEDVPQGNLGQAGTLIPPAGATSKGRIGQGPSVGILQFRGNDEDPLVVTTSIEVIDQTNSGQAFGPIVGIAEWGAGQSGMHVAEFDVPGNNYTQAAQTNFGFTSPGGGVLLALPCSSLKISLRNDGRYVPPVGDLPIGFNTQTAFGMSTLGVGNRPSNQLFRTIYQVNASAGNGLAAAASTSVVIPPFAKTARVLRIGAAAPGNALNIIQTGTAANSIDSFAVAANALCPEFPIAGGATFLTIKNTGADEILTLAVVYSIGI